MPVSADMSESEKVHYLTEGIYRNILENFNPGIKQLISTGRALQKALHNVATATKTYIDCIYALSQTAQVCKGATSEIGTALLQIAEVHKEINSQVIDNIKSFHAELLIPVENKQEGEFKQISLIHKKYQAGHKYHQNPVNKAQHQLKKHKKKSKSAKYGFDQKDIQYSRELKELQVKLDEYRLQNLRQALLEERKRYCFLLDRTCAMVRNYASHHSKAHELTTHRLPEWSEQCRNAHLLPRSSEGILRAFSMQIKHDDVYNNPATQLDDAAELHRTAVEYDSQQVETGSVTYGSSPPPSVTYGVSPNHQHVNFNVNTTEENLYSSQPTQQTVVTKPSPLRRIQMRALYTHIANTDTQLSFSEGDIILVIGEKREGWQYGENTNTNRLGWFPIAFTQPATSDPTEHTQPQRMGHTRVRSLTNLQDVENYVQQHARISTPANGPSDHNDMGFQQGLPGNTTPIMLTRSQTITERPVSLYSQNMVHIPSRVTEIGSPPDVECQSVESDPPHPRPTTFSQQRATSVHCTARDYIQTRRTKNHPLKYQTGSVPDVSLMQSRHQQPAPPMTTPPVPPPGSAGPQTPHRHPKQAPPLPQRSDSVVYANPQLMRSSTDNIIYDNAGSKSLGALGDYALHQPRPHINAFDNHIPSPPPSSSGYSGSSNRANQSSTESHNGYTTPNFPPPPPPLSPPAPPPLPSSDNVAGIPTIPENPFRNNPFTGVKLKKTVTNDRSAPKL